jgi:CHAT domain-containing protein
MKSVLVALFLSLPLLVHAQDSDNESLKELELGFTDVKRKDFVKAVVHFKRAMELADQGSETQLIATYQRTLYYNYLEESEKPEVIKATLRSLVHLRTTKRDDTLAADLFFRGGIAYELEYLPDSALQSYNEARKKYERFFGKESVQVSDCYHRIGDVYQATFYDFNTGESYYEKALAIRENKKNDELNVFLVSRLYAQLSATNRAQRDLVKALAYGLRNVVYAESFYPLKRESTYGKNLEFAYYNVASIYRDQGNYVDAELYYKKAISVNTGIYKSKNNGALASYYFGLAETFQKQGLLSKAIINYKKAIAIYSSSLILKDILYISCLEQLGKAYLQNREPTLAHNVFRKGMSLVNQYNLPKSGQAASLHKSVGDYFKSVNKPDSALIHYQYSLIASSNNFRSLKPQDNPPLELIQLKDYSYEALLQKANVLYILYKQTNKIEYARSALQSFDLAEQLLTLARVDLDTEDSKWIFSESHFDLYEQIIASLYELNSVIPSDSLTDKAFYYIESSKSKMLADALNEAEFADPSMTQDSLIQLVNLKKRNLHYLQDKLKDLNSSTTKDREILISAIQKEVIETDRKIQLTEQLIDEKYPSYINIKYRHKVASVNELKEFAKREKTSVVEFFWGSQNVYAFMTDGSQVSFKIIGATNGVRDKLAYVLKFLTAPEFTYSKETVDTFASDSHQLFKTLIAPFYPSIREITRIIVIPDGLISQLPFDVLITSPAKSDFSGMDYLVKSHALSYSFSASFLLAQKASRVVHPKMLAFGFTEASSLRSGEKNRSLNEIAGSALELSSLSGKFPDGEFLTGDASTEQKFKEKASDCDFLHLAIHGQGDSRQNYSASLFFSDADSSQEDGELHWYELFGMHINAKLTVISSCESGIGKSYKGEGILSMANAFAYAGCRNIVMGLWKVNDGVSVQLMNEFYQELKNGKSVDEALAESKRRYLESADEYTANPKMWASLAAYGNQRVVESNFSRTIIMIMVILLTALCCFYFYNKRKRDIRLRRLS